MYLKTFCKNIKRHKPNTQIKTKKNYTFSKPNKKIEEVSLSKLWIRKRKTNLTIKSFVRTSLESRKSKYLGKTTLHKLLCEIYDDKDKFLFIFLDDYSLNDIIYENNTIYLSM